MEERAMQTYLVGFWGRMRLPCLASLANEQGRLEVIPDFGEVRSFHTRPNEMDDIMVSAPHDTATSSSSSLSCV